MCSVSCCWSLGCTTTGRKAGPNPTCPPSTSASSSLKPGVGRGGFTRCPGCGAGLGVAAFPMLRDCLQALPRRGETGRKSFARGQKGCHQETGKVPEAGLMPKTVERCVSCATIENLVVFPCGTSWDKGWSSSCTSRRIPSPFVGTKKNTKAELQITVPLALSAVACPYSMYSILSSPPGWRASTSYTSSCAFVTTDAIRSCLGEKTSAFNFRKKMKKLLAVPGFGWSWAQQKEEAAAVLLTGKHLRILLHVWQGCEGVWLGLSAV